MNFAAFTFLAMPRGFVAALLGLLFLAVTGEAIGPCAGVNPARGAAPRGVRLAGGVAIFGAREADADFRGPEPANVCVRQTSGGVRSAAGASFLQEMTQATTARAAVTAAPSFLYSVGMVVTPAVRMEVARV